MARSRASAFKAQQYWVYEAHQREEACDLARQLNLALPNGSPGGNECDIMYPLHRLVITGQDTLPNLHLLFGPASDALAEPHARARQTVLLNARSGLVDDEAPYIRPRKASRAEQDELSRQLQFGKEYRGLLPHCFGGTRDIVLEGEKKKQKKKRRDVEEVVVVGNGRHSNSSTNKNGSSKRLRGHDTGSGYPSPEWMDTSE